MRYTCALMNIGPLLGIKFEFILGTEDVMHVQFGKKTEVSYLIWGYNVIFWLWKMD